MYAHEDGDEYMLLKTGGRWQSRLTRPESWGTWEDWRGWSGTGETEANPTPRAGLRRKAATLAPGRSQNACRSG